MSTESAISRNDHWFLGEKKVLHFTVVDSAGAAVNITGWALNWVLTDKPGTTALITKTTSSGITITNGAGGVYQVTIDAADQTTLAAGTYYYRSWRTTSGSEQALAFGPVTLLAT